MKKRLALIMAMLTVTCSFAACGKDADTVNDQVTADVTADDNAAADTVTEAEEDVQDDAPEGFYHSELTNELIDESLKDQRPIAAMIDNELYALPHYGLSENADVVYEMMNSTANGRITRFMVLVKDWEKIEQLGSIRSVRPTNLILAAEWNAVVCHDGGPFYIDEYLAHPWTDHFSGTFSRVNNGKPREYTEYIVSGDLDRNFSSTGVSTTYTQYYEGVHYKFASESEPVDLSSASDAIEAASVDLPFPHNGSYLEYDESEQVYKYSEYGKAHVDPGNDNAQLAFKNLLLQSCDFEQLDEHGYMIYNCIASNQDGYYVTNGEAIPITWTKTTETSPTRYYDMSGNEIKINTGKTYVALVPSDSWDELEIK